MFQKKLHTSNDGDEILINKWKETKDQKVINEIIHRHIHLIHKIANGYRKDGLEIHDLVAEGILGLIHSIDKFQVTKNVKFSTYAYYWIRAKINMYAWKTRNIINISTSKKNHFIFSILKEINEEKISKEDGIKKIAEKENISLKEANDHMRLLSIKMKSLNAKINCQKDDNNGDATWEDYNITNDHEKMIEEVDIQHIMSLIHDILNGMSVQEKKIINERWLTENPKTLQELSKEFNMSTEGVRKMEIRTLEYLREAISAKIYDKENYKKLMEFIFILTMKIYLLL